MSEIDKAKLTLTAAFSMLGSFMGSFLIGAIAMICRDLDFSGLSQMAMYSAGGCILLTLVINLIRRQSWKSHLVSLITTTFGAAMGASMILMPVIVHLSQWASDIPKATAFAQNDFAHFDQLHSGTITCEQVNAFLEKQSATLKTIADLNGAVKAEQDLDTVHRIDAHLHTEVMSALENRVKELQTLLLPDEQVSRLLAVKHLMYPVGHPLNAGAEWTSGKGYGVSVDELMHGQHALETKFGPAVFAHSILRKLIPFL